MLGDGGVDEGRVEAPATDARPLFLQNAAGRTVDCTELVVGLRDVLVDAHEPVRREKQERLGLRPREHEVMHRRPTRSGDATRVGNDADLVGMTHALGVEDVRPRIEPATEAHAVLMPAIDGIKPNEINPLDKMYYLNSWKY